MILLASLLILVSVLAIFLIGTIGVIVSVKNAVLIDNEATQALSKNHFGKVGDFE